MKRHGGAVGKYAVFRAEMYKLLIASRAIFLIIVLLVGKCVISYRTLTPKKSFEDFVYGEYMTEFAGGLTEEKRERIREIRTEIDRAIAEYAPAFDAFENGEMSYEEFSEYSERYSEASSRDEIFKRIEDHAAYIDEKRDKGTEAEFVYDTGWKALFFTDVDYMLFAAVVVTAAGAFSVEYEKRSSSGGAAQVIRATRRGRRDTFASKLGASVLIGVVLTVLCSAVDAFFTVKNYSLPLASSPLASIERFGDYGGALPIRAYTVVFYVLRIFGGAMLAGVTCALSCIMKNAAAVLSTVTAVVLLPDLLHIVGMDVLLRFGFTSLLRGTPLFVSSASGANDYIYLVIYITAAALISSAAIYYSERMWNK